MPGIDPISIGASAAQGLLGIGQAIFGGIKAKKYQRQMGDMIDRHKPNESIMDYYNKALSRYNSNPYQSTTYQKANQDTDETFSQGVNALQGRHGAVAGVSRLAAIKNNSLLKAGAQAESEQGQRLAQLGQATAMRVPEDEFKFREKYNLLGQRAGAANQTANAGIGNAFKALGSITDYANIDKMYGTGGSKRTKKTKYSMSGPGEEWS